MQSATNHTTNHTTKLTKDADYHEEEEEIIFNPFNEKNREVSEDFVNDILSEYGLPRKVHNIKLYRRAFVHKSYVKRPDLENEANELIIADRPNGCMALKQKSNERLEFLGDGVLECVTKYYLYKRFPKADEGFMTEKKIALVKNESIGRLAYEMGLNRWYIMSNNAEEKKTRTNLKKLGCLFEAFLGAIFLDFNKVSPRDEENWFSSFFTTGVGFQMAQIFVENVFEKHVDFVKLVKNDDNYKNIFQVKVQKEFKTTPVYMEMSEYDEETGYHMGVFICVGIKAHQCKIEDAIPYKQYGNFETIQKAIQENGHVFVLMSQSKHKIKKKAEQEACMQAINHL